MPTAALISRSTKHRAALRLAVPLVRLREISKTPARKGREVARAPVQGPPIVPFRYHMRAMRRVVNWLSGGYVDDMIQLALPDEIWHDEKKRPGSFIEVARTIEMGLVQRATKLPPGRARDPFAEYAEDLAKAFLQDSVPLTTWQEFLRRWYDSAGDRAKVLVKSHVPRPLLDQVQAHIEPWQVIVTALAIVIPALVQLLRG